MHQAPFTVYFSIIPRGASRTERLRHAQKISIILFSELQSISDIVTAQPGGGQTALWDLNNFSDQMPGTQVKPQFGESPAQLVITGFYAVNAPNVQPYANRQVFYSGRAVIGPVDSHLASTMSVPSPEISAEVLAIKTLLANSAIRMNEFYPDLGMRIWRLVYKGITWGSRGFHFPS